DAAVVAEHFERGGVPARAAARYLEAAQKALACGDPAMIALAERGLACGAGGEVRGGLVTVLPRPRWMRRGLPAAEALCDEALLLAPPSSRVACELLGGKAMIALQRGSDGRRVAEVVTAARSVTPSADNVGRLAELYWMLVSLLPHLVDAGVDE